MKRIYKYLQLQLSYLGNLINWFILLITRENLKCYIRKDKNNKELRIIGNGPSLNIDEVISEDLNVEYCMVNHACDTAEFRKIRPKTYVIADSGFVNNRHLEKVQLSWTNLRAVDWDMTIFVPFYLYKKTKELLQGSKLKVSCYHSASLKGWKKLAFKMYDKNLAMPMPGNVMIACVYVGILQGFHTIRLYGSDHSWTEQLRVNDKNQVCIKDVHYYDNSLALKPWNDETGKPFSMKIILFKFSEIFEQYEILEQYAKSRNVSIINMCPNSYIDAFKKHVV